MVLYTSIAGIDLWKWIYLLSDDKKKKQRLCGEPSDIDWRAAQDLSNKPVRNSPLESAKYKLSAKALFSELGFLRWHTLSTSLTEKVD